MDYAAVLPNDPPWLKEMLKLKGLSEIAGRKHEAKVLALYKLCGHAEIRDDETAWCAAAIGACLVRAGFPTSKPISKNLMARSYAKYGKACDLKKRVPRGAIIVWPRGAPPSGHVNICLHDDGTHLICIGGNQGNGRGGGVTVAGPQRKSGAIAARWPTGADVPLPKPKPEPTPETEPGMPVSFMSSETPPAVELEPEPAAAPERTQPEDGSQAEPKSMATSKIGLGQVATGTTVAVGGAAQVAKPFLETTTETIAQVSEVATQTGTIVETTRVVTTAVPDTIWTKIISALASPEFVACAMLMVITIAGLTWYWRRQHRRAGV